MSHQTPNYAEDLPELARPFAAAILAAGDAPLDAAQAAVLAQFRPEAVLPVHTSFAIHLVLLRQDDPNAKAAAAEYLAPVERAGLVDMAWLAVGHLRGIGAAMGAMRAAMGAMPPSLH